MEPRTGKSISGRTRLLFSGELTQPDNSAYTTLLDTTLGYPDEQRTAPPKSAALPTPGTATYQAMGRIYAFLVSCTDQNVTLLQYGLHADGAWHQFASTVITKDAAAQSFAWDPSLYGFNDVLIVVLAGGTKPTKVYAKLLERTVP